MVIDTNIFSLQLDFDDVLAEPSTVHGFDPIWRLSFVLFSQTKLWIYRIISAIVAVPLSIIWAIIFSLLSVLYVWVLRPIIRIIELFFAVFKRVISLIRKICIYILNIFISSSGCLSCKPLLSLSVMQPGLCLAGSECPTI